MSNQSARSLYELIGAPLAALVDAESQAARATAQFIRTVGFEQMGPAGSAEGQTSETDLSDFGKLKMVTFRYDRPVAKNDSQTYKIQVPLLSLVPIPALQIKDAELEFYARIVANPRVAREPEGTEASEKNETEDSKEEKKPGENHKLKKHIWDHTTGRDLKATIGREYSPGVTGRQRSLDMQIKVKVRMEQADVPIGLSRLFHIMEQNITSTEET
jgi:hypothetical protein